MELSTKQKAETFTVSQKRWLESYIISNSDFRAEITKLSNTLGELLYKWYIENILPENYRMLYEQYPDLFKTSSNIRINGKNLGFFEGSSYREEDKTNLKQVSTTLTISFPKGLSIPMEDITNYTLDLEPKDLSLLSTDKVEILKDLCKRIVRLEYEEANYLIDPEDGRNKLRKLQTIGQLYKHYPDWFNYLVDNGQLVIKNDEIKMTPTEKEEYASKRLEKLKNLLKI